MRMDEIVAPAQNLVPDRQDLAWRVWGTRCTVNDCDAFGLQLGRQRSRSRTQTQYVRVYVCVLKTGSKVADQHFGTSSLESSYDLEDMDQKLDSL